MNFGGVYDDFIPLIDKQNFVLGARIESINSLGEVVLRFNQTLFPIVLSSIGPKTLKVTIEPSEISS